MLIPSAMLRHEKDKFLDDVTIEELESALAVKVRIIDGSGYSLVDAIVEEA